MENAIEKKFERFFFKCFRNTIKSIDQCYISDFVKTYEPEHKTTFDEFQNLLNGEVLTLRDKFMAVDESKVYFYNHLGGNKAEYIFGLKDLKELYFNASLLTMKLVHYGREDTYDTQESDLYVVFTTT